MISVVKVVIHNLVMARKNLDRECRGSIAFKAAHSTSFVLLSVWRSTTSQQRSIMRAS